MLKRYRRAASLTQDALAERAGYSVGHISKLESSARQPVSATIELLADALMLSPAERSALGRAARHNGALPPAARHAHPRAQPPLIGRNREEARIERHLEAEAEEPLLLFAGEPGIGKSRLLQAAAEHGAHEGWLVVEGSCRRHGAQGPYGPLLNALASVIGAMDRSQLRTALNGCSWLVRLLPELAESGVAPMPAWRLPADQERRLMFSAVERFLRNIAGPAGTLLVLDNMQWAGADALDLLDALVEAAPRSPLRIIGAYRSNEVRPGSALAVLMADLAREGLDAQEVVAPLAPPASARLLDVLLAGAEHVGAPLRADVLRLAAGVPFVLVSYAQWLRTRANEEGDIPAELDIPWDVAQTVEQRIAALPEAAQMVVRIAAVSDGDDPRELLISVARRLGYDEIVAIAALDAACDAGLLVQRDDDMYAFAYDLIQEVVERGLGSAQRAYLHREIAAALESGHLRLRVEALADHYARAGEPEKALVYIERAGAQAMALHAYADAEHYYRTLADQMDSLARTREAAHAREQLGIMLGFMGRYDEALLELDCALESYRSEGWQDGQVRVAAQVGRIQYAQGEIEQGIARLERAAAAADGASDRLLAALYLSLTTLYGAAGLYGRELESARHAAELARSANDRHLLALAELERGTALGMLNRLDEGLQVLESAAIPLSGVAGDLWNQALALDRAAHDHILRGEFAEASAAVEYGMALGWQLDDQFVSGMMVLNRGMLRFYTGAWRQAQSDLRWASVMLHLRRLPSRAASALVWLGQLSLAKGRWERGAYELGRGLVLAEVSGEAQPAILAHCALAERELLDEQPEAARLRLEPLLADAEYRVSDVTGTLALLGWSHLELGDELQGEVLVAASVLRASVTGLRCALADALRIQMLVAAREGRWEDALADGEGALSVARSLPYPYAEAKTLYTLGQLLLRRDETERGYEHLAAARAILSRLGEHLYAQRIDRVLALAAPTGAR